MNTSKIFERDLAGVLALCANAGVPGVRRQRAGEHRSPIICFVGNAGCQRVFSDAGRPRVTDASQVAS